MTTRKTTAKEKQAFEYLNNLRESGETNMYGAAPYLQNEMASLTYKEAKDLLLLWMHNFNKECNYEEIKTDAS